MERNRWETAIRCLEVALHPHTGDDEVIAAVAGFRRTAAGIPLRDICEQLTTPGGARPTADAETVRWREKADALERDNHSLRRKLQAETNARADAARRLDEAERHVRELKQEWAMAQRRAAEAERYRTVTEQRAPSTPFSRLLAAARQRDGQPETVLARGTASVPRVPWTA